MSFYEARWACVQLEQACQSLVLENMELRAKVATLEAAARETAHEQAERKARNRRPWWLLASAGLSCGAAPIAAPLPAACSDVAAINRDLDRIEAHVLLPRVVALPKRMERSR